MAVLRRAAAGLGAALLTGGLLVGAAFAGAGPGIPRRGGPGGLSGATAAAGDRTPVSMGLSPGLSPGLLPDRRAQAPAAAALWVGAAQRSITPPSLTGVYLGGYGIGPVHPARGVLRPIYVQVLAVRDARGDQVLLGVLDVQGHFLAYQQGPYGFAQMAAWATAHLGIPARCVLLQSVHTHNGPDDLGIWGGVPQGYLAFVVHQTEQAMAAAVRAEVPARVSWAQVNLPGFTTTFGAGPTGDQAGFPTDTMLTVLQARNLHGGVIATLVNFAAHPTVYGPLDEVSPDWPGATASYLESREQDMPRSLHYGYPGSVAIVTVGAVGHTWPVAVPPAYTDPGATPSAHADNNYPADRYGDALARAAIAALAHAHPVGPGGVAGVTQPLHIATVNPVLLGLVYAPVPGYHIERSQAPAYEAGPVLSTWVTTLRIGDLLLTGAPGEEYPSIQARLSADVHAGAVVPFSLAMDQLGYITGPTGYAAAQDCSLTDEGLFSLSPAFGTELATADAAAARELGFAVSGNPALSAPPSPATLAGLSACAQALPGSLGVPVPAYVPGPGGWVASASHGRGTDRSR